MILTPIGECVEAVLSWNPMRDAADQQIDYVDLGAVDNEQKIVVGAQRVFGKEAPSRARQKVLAGDIVVSTVRPNLNGVARIPDHLDGATASTGFCVLRASSAKIDPAYLFHWVKTPAFVADMISKSTGASYPAVSDRIILGSLAPVPALPEQRRIAAILDQADTLRRLRRQAFSSLDALKQAIFNKMFGMASASKLLPARRLSDLAELINGDRSSNYPSGSDIQDSGIPFLSTTNIKNGQLDLSACNFITDKKFSTLSRGKLARNDIIVTLRGTLGQCALFDCEYETGFINAQMMIIRCSNKILPRYLLEYLSLPSVQSRLKASNSGTAVPQLTGMQMKELEIIVPDIASQREFVQKIQRVESLSRDCVTQSKDFDALFTSLQHRAFRGEL